MAKIEAIIISLVLVNPVYAFDVSNAAPEAALYAKCVYEMRRVDPTLISRKNNNPEEFVDELIARAFSNCETEEVALRRLGKKRGLSDKDLQNKINETKEALNAAIRLTIAKELVIDKNNTGQPKSKTP